MKRHRRKAIAIVLAVSLGFVARIDAILGIGDVVFDPSNFAQAVEQVIRLEQQTVQLIRSYEMLRLQYDQLVRSAQRVPVNMAARYRAVAAPWRPSVATNTYGTTGAWTFAANNGFGIANVFSQATEPLKPYGQSLTSVPADQLTRVKTAYGTVELTDGALQYALETVGHLRSNAAAVQSAIQALEDDSLSGAPEMNTQVAVLNKLNAASLISVRTAQDSNKLLVALAEHQAVQAKRTRDAEARAIGQHIRFMADGKAALAAQARGASTAMLSWRMP